MTKRDSVRRPMAPVLPSTAFASYRSVGHWDRITKGSRPALPLCLTKGSGIEGTFVPYLH